MQEPTMPADIQKDISNNVEVDGNIKNTKDLTRGKQKLQSWINKDLKIKMTDGRILIGAFLCTDRDGNVILGSCHEFIKSEEVFVPGPDEPRALGLVMVPGRHIVSIYLDAPQVFYPEATAKSN